MGLNSGDLRIYRINEDSSAKVQGSQEPDDDDSTTDEKPVELRREVERFSRRPIQQLAVIKEANVLVALSDGFVSFHDLQTFELSERLEITKGASTFAVISNVVKDDTTDMMTIESHLAVAAKRKILLWSWQDMELTGTPSELVLAAPVKSLAWMTRTKLVAGMDPGYVLIDIESRELKDIYRPAVAGEPTTEQGTQFGAVNSSGMGYMGMGSWVPKPMASKLAIDQMLLAKDVNTLFVDTQGNPLDKRQVPWAAAPEAIGYSYPYLLCLQPRHNGTLEVRNPETMSLLQSITLQGVNILHVPQANISLAHAGKGFLVSNERCIWRMNAVGYDPQIKDLVIKGLFDEALSLISLLEDTLIDDKLGRLRTVKIQKAEYLFHQQKYRQSMELFSEASAPPQQVIALYPQAIAGSLSTVSDDGQVQRLLSKGTDKSAPSTPKKSTKSVKNIRTPKTLKDSDASSVKSGAKASSDSDDIGVGGRLGKQNTCVSGFSKLTSFAEGKDLKLAVQELLGFLAQTRVQIQKYIGFDGVLKDVKNASAESVTSDRPPYAHFLSNDDNKQEIDWPKSLLETAKIVDTTLFRAHMFARPGLAGALFRLDNFCDPQVVEEKLYESKRYPDLIDFLHGKKLHQQALEILEKLGKDDAEDVDEALRGPHRMVSYLQHLPPEQIDIILKYAQWPLEVEGQLGMQIFIVDTVNAETLPRENVLHFLEGLNRQLSVQYLEHVIDEWHDDTSTFHDRLIELYLEELKSRKQDQTSLSIESLQSHLQDFLIRSTNYNCRRVLNLLDKNDSTFFEARAIVHGKLHQHSEALNLYVFALASPQKAEAYCNQVFASTDFNRKTNDTNAQIYTTLLKLYLAPAPPQQQNLEAALDLLSRHGSRLPALSTLDFLPPSLSVQKLQSYFVGRMRAANTLAREQAMLKSLSSVAKANTDIALQIGDEGIDEKGLPIKGDDVRRGQNRRLQLTEERMCSVCHKRFGRAAVRVWPNGEVRHYGCGEGRRLGVGRGVGM